MLAQRKEKNVRAGAEQKILRYSGLLVCKDCGRAMTGKRLKQKRGTRVVYECSTYHRYGKEHCPSHVIDESFLDELIMQELLNTKWLYLDNWKALEKLKRDIGLIDDILKDGQMTEAHLRMLVEKILVHEEEGEIELEICIRLLEGSKY